MDYKLKNKTALITGSTSGIGLAVAKLLCAEGVQVTINGRTEANINAAIKEVKHENPDAAVQGMTSDFSDKRSVENLISRMAPIDILVNNVGIFTSQSFSDTSDEDWYRLFEVNVMSGIRLSRAVLPEMLKNNWGRIIFISSECAQLVPSDLMAYSMTKAAILSLSRGLAQTTRGTSVTVNSVLPGSTLSEGAKRFLQARAEQENSSEDEVAAKFFKDVRTSSLLQRFASTEEIAHAVAYLASPLSSATNGAVLKADGGSVGGII